MITAARVVVSRLVMRSVASGRSIALFSSASAAVIASSRMALSQMVPMQVTSRQPFITVFTLRHFSSPPLFLDPAEVTDRILTVVKNFDQVDPLKVTPDTEFVKDLGLDSLDIVEVVMAIEDEFAIEIPDQEADKITTIKQAVEYISSHPMAK